MLDKGNHNAITREDEITPQTEQCRFKTFSGAIVEHDVTLVDTATNTNETLNENHATQTTKVPYCNATC